MICNRKDINRVIDKVFNEVTKSAKSYERLNDSSIRVNVGVATDSKIKKNYQAVPMAEKVVAKIEKEFLKAGFNEYFIKQFKNKIVKTTDYSKDSGIVVVTKVVSDDLVAFIEAANEYNSTQEQLFQEAKEEENRQIREAVIEAEYQQAEALGITREQHDELKQLDLDLAMISDVSTNEANTAEYYTETPTYLDALDDTARTFLASPSPVQNLTNTKFDNYIKFKKNQQYRLEKKLAQVKKMKAEIKNNPATMKQLLIAEEKLKDYLETTKSTIKKIENDPNVNEILFNAQNDIARVKYLSQSFNAESLQEAKDIINFFKASSDFSNSSLVSNPLFERESISNDINVSEIPLSLKTALQKIYEDLIEYEVLINNREQQAIIQNLSNLEQIKNNPHLVHEKTGGLSYNKIFNKDNGLRDITLGEMYFFDPSSTLLRDNGVVPQAVQIMLDNAYNKAHITSKKVIEDVDALLPRVTKVLRDLGHTSKVFGNSVGVNWDLFRAKDSNGLLRDGIVQRYTSEFIDSFAEMQDKFKTNISRALDPSVSNTDRADLLNTTHTNRDNWLRSNTLTIDPRKIPEIQALFPNQPHVDDNQAHANELKKLLGETGYKEEIQKQIDKIEKYELALSLEKEKLASVTGAAYLNKIKQFENRNNPFIAADFFERKTYPTRGLSVDFTNMKYSYSVPLNKKGFYDTNFEKIEANPDLKEFHDLLQNAINQIQDNLTPELQAKLSTTSLPQLQKPLMEIFADPYLTTKAKMSLAYRRFMEFIRSLYTINPQTPTDNSLVDVVTGKKLDQVNSNFLQGAKDNIDRQTTVVFDKFLLNTGKTVTKRNQKYKTSWGTLTPSEELFLIENLNPSQVASLKKTPNKVFSVKSVINDAVTHEIISENSFDLPKIVKLYTKLTMEFSARNEVLPSIKLMLEHYKMISNPETTNQGSKVVNRILGKPSNTGDRHFAVKQIESWFNRVALGNNNKENEFIALPTYSTAEEERKALEKRTRDSLTKEDKKKKIEYENIIKQIEEQLKNSKDKKEKSELGRKRAYYDSQINLLGRKKSWSAVADANFAFIRVLGLGWNLSSQFTNLFEGQISNLTLGASGQYFSAQNLERANNIIFGSFLKNLTFNKISTPGARKAAAIMKKFDVMQDATNDLQKASNKNPLDNANKFLSPFALISKVEYINQTPVVIAVLMDQMITSVDGTKSLNVWDAMNPDGSLKEEFRTEENVNNWEGGKGEQYDRFTSLVGQTLAFHHGDYSKIRGMMAAEQMGGKTILMFKRWATMWLQSRIAMPHVTLRNKEAGIQKGRYRSHTKSTGAISGGIFGATILSGALTSFGMALPALLPVIGGAVLGYQVAKRLGMENGGTRTTKEVLGVTSVLQESALTMKLVALKMIGIPLNTITGKQIINHNPFFASETNKDLAVDARNFKANLSEIAIQLSLLGMATLVRAAWGDDPEDEKKYNLMSNKIGKLLKQTVMFLEVESLHSLFADFAIIRYLQNLQKFAVEFALVFGTEDLPVMKSGPSKGEYKVVKAFKSAFLPSMIRDKNPLTLGFGTELDQFYEFNKIGIVGKAKHGTEQDKAKDELKKIKNELLKQYVEDVDGLTYTQKQNREKIINKITSKAKDQDYTHTLENLEKYLEVLASSYGEGGDSSFLDKNPSKNDIDEEFELETSSKTEEEIEQDEKDKLKKTYEEALESGEDITNFFDDKDYTEEEVLGESEITE